MGDPVTIQVATIRERLRVKYADLTPSQRVVADAIMSTPQQAAMANVHKLAGAIGVSAATIVRFAVALGYTGFTELQEELRTSMIEALSPNTPVDQGQSRTVYARSIARDSAHLGELAANFDEAAAERAVRHLIEARRVYVRGSRTSWSVAAFFATVLAQLRTGVKELIDPDSFSESVSDVGPDDVLVVVHLPRYARSTLSVGKYFREQGASIILISDSVKAPLSNISDVLLTVPYGSVSFFNSNVAAIAVANAILAGFTTVRHEVIRQRLDAAEDVFSRFKTHVLSHNGGEPDGITDD